MAKKLIKRNYQAPVLSYFLGGMFDKVKGIFGKKKNMGSGVSGSTDNIANDTRGLDTLNRLADEAAARNLRIGDPNDGADYSATGPTDEVVNSPDDGGNEDTANSPTFGSKFKSGLGTMGNLASSGLSAAGNIAGMFGPKNAPANSNDLLALDVAGLAADTISQVGGVYGKLIGGAIKLSQATGLSSTATKGAGKLNDALNFVAAITPGTGLFAKKTEDYKVSEDLANSSGFGGTLANNQKMAGNAGRKVLFGRNKLNSKIKDAQAKDIAVSNILTDNKELMASLGDNAQDIYNQDMFMKMGGYDLSAFLVKNGGSIRELARKAKLQRERQLEEVASMQKGGRIGSKSIIPGGALHARKHQLKDFDEGLAKQVTHKGVPVVSFEFGGEVDQHAEIERGEIIFRKLITDKLEELWKDGSDEAAIKAGKLIAKEIGKNTIDNSGEYEIENLE